MQATHAARHHAQIAAELSASEWVSKPVGLSPRRGQGRKRIKKSKTNPENRKKILVDPGRHFPLFPVPYVYTLIKVAKGVAVL